MTALRLLIGNKNLSSWSLRPWLALRQAGIPFEERVLLFEEPGWRDRMAELSPSGRVPALRVDGAPGTEPLVVWDSLAICEYAAELYPDAMLWPSDRTARAFGRSMSAEMHSGFSHLRNELSMDVVARAARPSLSREAQADVERVQGIWDECRARFGKDGPFLLGRFSIADAMFAPVVFRFRTYDLPPPERSRARDWYETMLALPAMQEWERAAETEVREARAKAEAAHAAGASRTPDPSSAQHCFAVIFASQVATTAGLPPGYEETAAAMEELAKKVPGFLGIESARGADGFGITVSYWESLEAIARWKAHAEHREAQGRGRTSFYSRYEVRICTVERGYKFARASSTR